MWFHSSIHTLYTHYYCCAQHLSCAQAGQQLWAAGLPSLWSLVEYVAMLCLQLGQRLSHRRVSCSPITSRSQIRTAWDLPGVFLIAGFLYLLCKCFCQSPVPAASTRHPPLYLHKQGHAPPLHPTFWVSMRRGAFHNGSCASKSLRSCEPLPLPLMASRICHTIARMLVGLPVRERCALPSRTPALLHAQHSARSVAQRAHGSPSSLHSPLGGSGAGRHGYATKPTCAHSHAGVSAENAKCKEQCRGASHGPAASSMALQTCVSTAQSTDPPHREEEELQDIGKRTASSTMAWRPAGLNRLCK